MMTLVHFPSSPHELDANIDVEDQIARLTDAAYRVVLQHGLTGSFVDVQLGIWSAVRSVIEAKPTVDEDDVHNRRAHRQVPARIARRERLKAEHV